MLKCRKKLPGKQWFPWGFFLSLSLIPVQARKDFLSSIPVQAHKDFLSSISVQARKDFLSSIPVQTCKDFLAAGKAQAHRRVGSVADGRQTLLLDLVPQHVGNLFHTVPGKELVGDTVAHHLCQGGSLLIVNQLLHKAQIDLFLSYLE